MLIEEDEPVFKRAKDVDDNLQIEEEFFKYENEDGIDDLDQDYIFDSPESCDIPDENLQKTESPFQFKKMAKRREFREPSKSLY